MDKWEPKFGEMVEVSQRLIRRSKESVDGTYFHNEIAELKAPRQAVFLGTRTLNEGFMYNEEFARMGKDRTTDYRPLTKQVVALICTSNKTNPVYAPLENLKPIEKPGVEV